MARITPEFRLLGRRAQAEAAGDALAAAAVAGAVDGAAAGVLTTCCVLSGPAGAVALAPLSVLGATAVSLAGEASVLPPRKSVTYQPVPLSWKPAAVTCFSNADWPQLGQSLRGASDIFCKTSLANPQELHL